MKLHHQNKPSTINRNLYQTQFIIYRSKHETNKSQLPINQINTREKEERPTYHTLVEQKTGRKLASYSRVRGPCRRESRNRGG